MLYEDFTNNSIDKERTTSRYAISSCSGEDERPILFRHYIHEHIDTNTYNQTNLYSHSDWCSVFIAIDVCFNFITETNMYSPHCGDIVLIRDNAPYNVFYYNSQQINYYSIDIPCSVLKRYPNLTVFSDMFYGANRKPCQMLRLPHDKQTKLFTLLCEAEEEIGTGGAYCDNMIFASLIAIANLICENIGNEYSDKKIAISPKVKTAIDYISENYLTIQSIDEIAAHANISSSYLNRIFKYQLNTTPIEYINNLRLSFAKYLLKEGCSVTDTCYRCGFGSYNYFIAAFKKHIGMTPKEYAKSK